MDWQQLRYFLALAAAGSLAGAARRLGVSKATAWRQVHALEEALGTRLFERDAKGYALTPIGRRFLANVESIGRTIDLACQAIASEPATVEGEVRVTAPELLGDAIAGRLPDLAMQHPGLALEMIVGSPAATLTARETDIALRFEQSRGVGFRQTASFPIRFAVYGAPAYLKRFGAPKRIDDFSGHRLIDFEHTLAHLAPDAWRRSGGRGAEIVFRCNSPHARLAAARAGIGLALVAEVLGNEATGVVPVLDGDTVGALELFVLVAARLQDEPRVAAAREFLCDVLAEATGTPSR